MKYIELTIHTTTEASEIISDIMWAYTDYGVTICDRADIIALQTAKESAQPSLSADVAIIVKIASIPKPGALTTASPLPSRPGNISFQPSKIPLCVA